jgi:hypothetical protein
MGGGNTVARLGPYFDFPQLLSLTLLLAGDKDIDDTVKNPRLIEGITHLAIADNGRLIPTLAQLFERLPTVTHLDLSDTTGGTFQQLIIESARRRIGETPIIFPSLTSITLSAENVNDVQNFCIMRGAKEGSDGSHMLLKELVVPKTIRLQRFEDDKWDWIQKHVTSIVIDRSYRQLYVNHESLLRWYRK